MHRSKAVIPAKAESILPFPDGTKIKTVSRLRGNDDRQGVMFEAR